MSEMLDDLECLLRNAKGGKLPFQPTGASISKAPMCGRSALPTSFPEADARSSLHLTTDFEDFAAPTATPTDNRLRQAPAR